MKRRIFAVVIASLVLIGSGCGVSYDKAIKQSEETFYYGKYKEAARMLLPNVNKSGKDQLLFMMECGLMLHAAGDFPNSNKVLLEAGKLADRITLSVSKEAASLFLNETVTNYRGEDFERVLIHLYSGINFLMMKKYDEGRVEFKKVNDLLRDINVTTGKTYKQNLMAKYLTAIAFEIVADRDKDAHDREFAYIEYKQILELDPRLAMVYRDLQRLSKQLNDMDDYNKWKGQFGIQDNLPAQAGELVLIYQAGKSAVKVSRGSLLSDKAMEAGIRVTIAGMPMKEGVTLVGVLGALRIAENPIPKFKKRDNRIKFLRVNVNGRYAGQTYLLEDVENTAVKNLEDDYNRLYMKTAAGIAVKVVTSIAAGVAAKKLAERNKNLGAWSGLIGAATGALVGGTLISQIKPDLRCWHTLPANFQLGRIFLPPGKYNITIDFIDAFGRVERSKESLSVEIKAGEKTFFNYRTLY